MACFYAASIAHFCQWPRLPPRRQCPLSFFCKCPRLTRRSARYQKLSNPLLPLFARSANCTHFLRLAVFQHKAITLQNRTYFCVFHLLAKISTFLHTAILRAFLAFFIFTPIFQKQEFFCVRQKSGSILITQKEGGFFILSHQNNTLN